MTLKKGRSALDASTDTWAAAKQAYAYLIAIVWRGTQDATATPVEKRQAKEMFHRICQHGLRLAQAAASATP
ncbi:MAG: hypothetical protein R3C68_05835 [Myxococcota bacterium]